jgi:anaerobic magnesium-protoporphyrin IX monomethyl ester cyclase
MKVLLIGCQKLSWMGETKGTIPVPLLHLGASLQKAGHSPTILDLSIVSKEPKSIQDESFIDIIKNYISQVDPGLIGINCFVSQHVPFILKTAQKIKEFKPDLHLTIGGAHPTMFASDILENCREIDSIVLGEGEEQIVAIADLLESKRISEMNSIQALAYRVNGAIKTNLRKNYITELDSLPEASWDLINFEDYYSDHSDWHNPKNMNIQLSVPILTSRSCPFNCNFCACHKTMGRVFRMRSPKKVVDEIEHLNKEYGLNYFGFIDDNVNLNKDHIIGICHEIVQRRLDIQFEPTCGLYLGRLDEEIAYALGKAGCVFARLPIEHGNDYIRNEVIGKNLSREQIFRAKKLLKDNGMRISTMSIMGFPEDTPKTLQDTYDLLSELKADLNYVFNLIPFPGTKVFEQAKREGLLLSSFSKNQIWKGEIDLDPVQKVQQYYLKPKNMSLEQLDHYREKFNEIRVMYLNNN